MGTNSANYWYHEENPVDDKGKWLPGGSIAGNTGQNVDDDTSYIHIARLSRLSDPENRFFEYMQTIAHEIWHQNNPTPSDREFGDPMIEAAADKFADRVVEAYVRASGDARLKREYTKYLGNRFNVGQKWSNDFWWQSIEAKKGGPTPFWPSTP